MNYDGLLFNLIYAEIQFDDGNCNYLEEVEEHRVARFYKIVTSNGEKVKLD